MLVHPAMFAQWIFQTTPLSMGYFRVRQVTVLCQKRRDVVKGCQVLLRIFLRGGKAESPRDEGLASWSASEANYRKFMRHLTGFSHQKC